MKTLALIAALLTIPALAQDAGVLDSGVVAVVDAGVAPAPVVMPTEPVTGVVSPSTSEPNIDIKFVVDSAKAIHDAVKNKAWGRLIFLIITVLVIFCRKILAPRVAFFRGKFGAPLLAFFWAAAGMLGTTWPAGTKLDAQDVWMALEAGLLAAGGWSLLKNTLEHFYPKDGTQNWATVIGSVIGAFSKPEEPKSVEAPKPVA